MNPNLAAALISDTRQLRMGFMLDVADYGGRTTRAKERVQERLAALIRLVLEDLDVRLSDVHWQGTGDGVLLFLPGELDVQRALPVLLHSTATHLAFNNEEFRDRLRLRMAVDVGPVGLAQLGFGGGTATNLGRLLDSEPLREWLVNHLGHDLAVIVSDRLHSFVVAEDVPALPPAQFNRVFVQIKEFASIAWLWTRTKTHVQAPVRVLRQPNIGSSKPPTNATPDEQ
jgi:hypothetical protein